MIVEQRSYTIQPGRVADYLSIYEREGLAVQTHHLPHMLGYFFTEIGPLNQIVHMWGYEDLMQRGECRSALYADDKWQNVLKKLLPLIVHMETKILLPTKFSPIGQRSI